ncbi:MAG: PAS domain S-box protein [Acidobacteria bacterium]|nr:PAS domain S-box protein [Acidobacteriota bacterium]
MRHSASDRDTHRPPPLVGGDSLLHHVLTDVAGDVVALLRFDPPEVVYVSDSVAALTGYTAEQFYANPSLFFTLVHAEDRGVFVEMPQASGEPHVEVRLVHRDGRAVWTEVARGLTTGEDGTPLVLAIFRDVSHGRQQGAARAAADLRYRQLFLSNPVPMWVYDLASLRFLAVNDAAVRRYGYSREEFLAMDVTEIRPPDQVELFKATIASVGSDAYTSSGWHHVARDGTRVDVEITSHGIDYNGRLCRVVMAYDVTERRRAAEQREALERALQQSQKMESVGRLAGGIAHDFNNMLTVIAGFADLISMDLEESDPDMADRAREIVKATKRATELTKKLLIFSRRHPYEPRTFELDVFVRQEWTLIARVIGEEIRMDTALGAPGVHVRIDPTQLSQVVMNLVVNARDAMPEGGSLTIATEAQDVDDRRLALHPGTTSGQYVCLRITDTGHGMDARVREHLFEPFFTTKEAGRGTGLGLPLVYGIVRQAGGFVEVQSQEGAGTTMAVWLPRTEKEREAPESEAEIAARQRGHETVLLVEDEASVRQLSSSLLRRYGYTVIEAAAPDQALALVANGTAFDVVVTDVVMPVMNGRRMIEEIARLRGGPVRVLYVSGYADTGAADAADLVGRYARFLQKPFTPRGLAGKLREVLGA